MGTRLSHSAKEKYLGCPLSWHMHYNLGYREIVLGSALYFGSAVDEGFNVLLLGGSLEGAKGKFHNIWKKYRDSKNIKYSKSDLDTSLFPEDYDEKANPSWLSLYYKGIMLIEAYHKEIMPRIKKVHDVQKYFSIENKAGDQIVGYIDLICEWEDGRLLNVDNKTSAKAYPKDIITNIDGKEVNKTKQLALYNYALKKKLGIKVDGDAFFVAEKSIRKREPRVRITPVIGEVPEELVKTTLDEFKDVLYGIRMGQFESNHPNCNTFYGKCICDKYYPSGGSDLTGLMNKDKKK